MVRVVAVCKEYRRCCGRVHPSRAKLPVGEPVLATLADFVMGPPQFVASTLLMLVESE